MQYSKSYYDNTQRRIGLFTISEYLNLTLKDKDNIKSVEIIPPKIGSLDSNKIAVEFKHSKTNYEDFLQKFINYKNKSLEDYVE